MRKHDFPNSLLSQYTTPCLPNSASFAEPGDGARSSSSPREHRNRLTNLHTNASVYLGVCELLARTSEDVGHPEVLSLVFTVLAQTFPGNHDGYRRFGNEVVAEGAKQYTATVSLCISCRASLHTL